MKGKKELIIGITVVSAVALLVFGIDFLKGVNFFNNNRIFYSKYNNAQNLMPGSLIKVSGVQMGVVKSIFLSEDQQDIMVEMNISNSELKIPANSKAKLGSDLLGTSYIDLIIGQDTLSSGKAVPSKGPFLKQYDTIPPQVQYGAADIIQARIEPVEAKVQNILIRVEKVVGGIEGALGKEGEELKRIMNSLKTTLSTVNTAVADIDELVLENKVYITKTMKNIESITGNLKQSNEKVTKLIANFTDLSDTLKNTDITGTVAQAKDALAQVSTMMDEINNGDGTLHQLIYTDTLNRNLNAMIQETERLINNIKEHPNRYLQIAIFGRKDKGIKLDATDEKKLKKMLDEN